MPGISSQFNISSNQNSKSSSCGPLLPEFANKTRDPQFREAGAFGYFECVKDMTAFTSAHFLGKVGKRSPVLSCFSTKSLTKNSFRVIRDFSVQFYTENGNFDIISKSMPLRSSEKSWSLTDIQPDRLLSTIWTMSDRALPRSYRTIEGFSTQNFRLLNCEGKAIYARFHWRPRLGDHGISWEECRALRSFEPDYHRRDLWEAIQSGNFPVWELGVQLIPEEQAHHFSFYFQDFTKLIPESLAPTTTVGHMILNRNSDNFFTELGKSSFDQQHLVEGIEMEFFETNSLKESGGGLADPLFQAQHFFNSQTDVEKSHIKNALVFEMLSEPSLRVRKNALFCLKHLDEKLARDVAEDLGMHVCSADFCSSLEASDSH